MRANHFYRAMGDTGNSNLIGSPNEEGCEGRAEGDFMATGQTSGYTDDVLLCDKALDEALRVFFKEMDCEGTVLGVPVNSYHVGVRLMSLH